MRLLGLWIVCASGCVTSLRAGAAPTVDSDGKWGAAVTVGGALGQAYRKGAAAVLVAAEVGGAVDERVRARGNGGHVALGVGVDALGESPRFGFRMGVTLDGRVVLPTGAAGGAVGGRVALLPVVHARHVGPAVGGGGGAVGGGGGAVGGGGGAGGGGGGAGGGGGGAVAGCAAAESWTYWHVGLELSGRYLWGPDARGLFAAGPVFELDALSAGGCD